MTTGTHEPGFRPTRALRRALLVTGLLIAVAMVFGRVDFVVLAAPFAIGAALSLIRRPHELPVVTLSTPDDVLVEGGELRMTISVTNPDPEPLDLIALRATASRYVRLTHLDRPYIASAGGGEVADITLDGRALRWGRPELGPAAAFAVAADGLLIADAAWAPLERLKVYPRTERFEADEAMPRAAGLVGPHRSRRPGEGGELAGVRMFAPGDRLRRIDWRVSLRTRELHVAATLSDRDAEVALLLDVLHEAGRSGGVFGRASVMDTTVRASAAIAEHYLHRGDRVSVVEYSGRLRRLRAASGRRQYLTLSEWLLDIDVAGAAFEPSPMVFGPHMFSANALIVVLTPLMDPRSAAMVARFARAGRFVVAVDTFPPDLADPPVQIPWDHLAARIWRMDRENTIALLREHGVPVVPWAGAGSLDLVLRQISRMATGPQAVPR